VKAISLTIPSLTSQARADVERHCLVVTYDPELLAPVYLERVVGKSGYPVAGEQAVASAGG
jgi:hypothetical protein